ncbi:uncharacterized protein LOC117182748 [Belonocnema kinseyi]|uniref:uncharacterized protein LOC117182748 n=1 Tax=Belonocnema kinseyi TaxID=2817044 RepID=UPI00143CED76|nr:uncharacterized protein LOC117182748 [Belonocnema kinseyi]
MGKEFKCSEASIRRIVNNDLNCYPYKLQEGHLLTDKIKASRLQRCKKLLRLAAAERHRNVLFSDEKVLTIERAHNHQNERKLLPKGSLRSKQERTVSKSHFPASVFVWGGICATRKIPLVFVEKGVKIDQKYYQDNILKVVVNPWTRAHFGENLWTFQQDWAPAHGAKATMQLYERLFPAN